MVFRRLFVALIALVLLLPPLLSLLPLTGVSYADIPVDQWRRHTIDSNRPWTAVFIDGGDLDGDGLADIVTGGWWYQNPGDVSDLWPRHEIGGELYNMAVVHDLDGDEDLDILGTKGQVESAEFVWAENDGHGSFTIHANLPAADGDFLQGCRAAQILPGGNVEVVLSWHDKTSTQMFEIPNTATDPWTWSEISSTTNGEQIAVGDVDGDGDLDIHLGTNWLRNDAGTWTTVDAVTLGDSGAQPDRVELAYVDQDNNLDVVIGAEGANRVVWGEAPADLSDAWTEHVISTNLRGMSLDVGDVDQDGDIDVVAGEHNTQNPDVGRVIIYQNENWGAAWTPVQVDSGLEHHDGTQFVDIDRDGDLDILSIGWTHDQVVLYENLALFGTPTPSPTPTATPTPIPTQEPLDWQHLSTQTGDLELPGTSSRQTSALILDVDQDGFNDFVIASQREGISMVWYRRHQRDQGGWDRYLIEDETLDIEAGGTFSDIDGDGDFDIVMGGDRFTNKVWWWENPRPENPEAGWDYDPAIPWARYEVKNTGEAKHHDQIFGDFDGDGREELAFWNQDAFKLFLAEIPAPEDIASPWSFFEIFSWSEGDGDHEGLATADINGDGKADIVGGGHWFEHSGGTNYTAHPIDTGETFSRAAAGQLKAGGRPEVVFVKGDGFGRLQWYEWTGTQWQPHDLLGFDADHGHSLQVADVNGDGHLDIFCAEMNLNDENPDAKAWVFLGDSLGNFVQTEVSSGYGNHESKVGDLDGDGDLDILGKPYRWDAPRLDIWLNGGTGQILPTPTPTNTPASMPTPTNTPVPAATSTPTPIPAAGIKLATGEVTGVGSTWQTVTLLESYASMVVVAAPNYEDTDDPAVVRVRNATGNSFELKVQNPSNAGLSGYSVHYVVVEEGVYTEAEHGVKMEAVKYGSSVTDESSLWAGESRSYGNGYSSPVVLGQVMTANDADWSVFWARGSTVADPPSSSALYVGKHVGQDPDETRVVETVGYIVIEAGEGSIGDRGYEATLGGDSVMGMENTPPFVYSLGGLSSAAVGIVSAAGMDGGDGGWPVLYGATPLSATSLDLAYDEDQTVDTERAHTKEQVAYLVFGEGATTPTATHTPTPTNVPDVTPTATPTSGTTVHSLSLAEGQNVFAWPLELLLDAEVALQEIDAQGGGASEVSRWLSGSDTWEGHTKDLPFGNFELELGQGYVLSAGSAITWTLMGQLPTDPVPVQLDPIWTLIGLPRLPESMTAQDLLDEATAQGGQCTEIYRWYDGGWDGHSTDSPGSGFALTEDEGYFVKCAVEITYVPGRGTVQHSELD